MVSIQINRAMTFEERNMLWVQLRQVLLLVTVFFVGCSYSQNKAVVESENQDKILFEGENIEVIESVKSNLEQIPFDNKETEFCFEEIEGKIKTNFPA